ncbi:MULTISPECIES: hypothetical protein [Gordonia]|jgi:hypothetical protein|uniref:Uncharacterized protein n=1 Tax=Gordonia alkanivorans CGMCC 6845 TaxID=1423140 RepID=W9DLM4_9ACTN|nr:MULTISPECIES: hypothetical protein [Gordonia]ETA08426.1 hypothetical protein V525_03170 [Gordonia alkanivorans CGMCC 6845]MDH3012179.1 hypothetical protein [Gordonia alkanivorans]MDH3017093.1 hypothetical protein [Gordonia alkanivorans]MDH3025355.1 hypothetical protein [Gordonia alkanivorans]MDH3042338.1 hypothetical protein [Gordonia alkanivorans]
MAILLSVASQCSSVYVVATPLAGGPAGGIASSNRERSVDTTAGPTDPVIPGAVP